MCFPNKIGVLRSDESFELRTNISHHLKEFKEKKNILEEAGIRMVSQFPLDAMHLVDLGVVKKLIRLISKRVNVKTINEKLNYVSQFVPSEFGRLPRSLEEVCIGSLRNSGNFSFI